MNKNQKKGMIYYNRHVCDGEADCSSAADELNCTKTTPQFTTTISTVTPSLCNGLRCLITDLCIPLEYKCDDYKDCKLGEDESCCSIDKFLCPSTPGGLFGNCIPRRTLCDGYKDCADGYDEINCTFTTTSVIKVFY